jgi:hypothetical protein
VNVYYVQVFRTLPFPPRRPDAGNLTRSKQTMHNESSIATTILDAIATYRGPELSARAIAEHVAPMLPGIPIGYLVVKAALALRLLFEMPEPEDFTDIHNRPLHGMTESEAAEALRYCGQACSAVAELGHDLELRLVAEP